MENKKISKNNGAKNSNNKNRNNENNNVQKNKDYKNNNQLNNRTSKNKNSTNVSSNKTRTPNMNPEIKQNNKNQNGKNKNSDVKNKSDINYNRSKNQNSGKNGNYKNNKNQNYKRNNQYRNKNNSSNNRNDNIKKDEIKKDTVKKDQEKKQNNETKKIVKENVVNVKNNIKKDEEKNSENNKKTNKIILIIILIILFVFLICSGLFFINFYGNKIQSNVYIESINVSNLTKEDAKSVINSKYKNIVGKSLKYSYKDKEYSINLDDIDFNLLINDSLEDAFSIGRNKNIFISVKDFYSLKFGSFQNINLNYEYNKEKLYSKIMEIEKDFYTEVKQYSYTTENNILKIENGTQGVKVNYEQVEQDLLEAVQNKVIKKVCEIPLDLEEPDEIDITKIHGEVYVEMKNAYYTTNPFEIHNEVQGVNFDIKALKEMIEAEPDKAEYTIELAITEPTTKVEDLDLYNEELGKCTTGYVNNPNRTVNLRLAASKIDGFILMPGETFSYNDVVGERTVSAGYRNAAIYINGEVEDGLAGGICQISSTLYNAVVTSNLEIVERSNHARVPSYLPAGKDATVYWGSKDFKFKNNREYPIKISVTVEGGYATAKILGTKTSNEYDISIETAVVSRYNGYLVVNAYKVYRQNGEVVNRELLSTDSYKI